MVSHRVEIGSLGDLERLISSSTPFPTSKEVSCEEKGFITMCINFNLHYVQLRKFKEQFPSCYLLNIKQDCEICYKLGLICEIVICEKGVI